MTTARRIVAKRKQLKGSELHENAVEAVVEGIALGRKRGLGLAIKLIADAIGKLEDVPE
jgi:hypothetical protein